MPDRAAVKKALSLMQRRAEYEYFFSKLQSPDWLEPLLEEERFTNPPPIVRDGDYIQFPSWPESQYLARVAEKAPQLAAKVLSSIPATDNARIHLDLLEVALKIEPKAAAIWARKEAQWLAQQRWLYFTQAESVAQLAVRLAENGYGGEAMGLIRATFEPQPDPKYQKQVEAHEEYPLPPRPGAKTQIWDYERALLPIVPKMVESLGIIAVNCFAEMLAKSLELSRSQPAEEGQRDYSSIWRSRIETSDVYHNDVRDVLIDAVRDSASIQAGKSQCIDVVDLLEEIGRAHV